MEIKTILCVYCGQVKPGGSRCDSCGARSDAPVPRGPSTPRPPSTVPVMGLVIAPPPPSTEPLRRP